MLECLRKDKNYVFGCCQQTSKVQCMNFEFKGLKVSSKKGKQLSES